MYQREYNVFYEETTYSIQHGKKLLEKSLLIKTNYFRKVEKTELLMHNRTEVYSGPFQTSTMEHFYENSERFKKVQ